jgi:hemerythrin-like domain-containing protein
MTQTLPQVAHEHHQRILTRVDAIPRMADDLLTNASEAIPDVVAMHAFFVGTLLPHIDAAESSIYPELERQFQNRHSMRPMRAEHDEVRRLVVEYGGLTADLGDGHISLGRTLAIRRVAFRLFSLLKVHLAEEDAYLRIAERGAGAEVSEVIAAALDHPIAG